MSRPTRADDIPAAGTIRKTLLTTQLFEGFWDRWIAHGIPREEAAALRPRLTGLANWNSLLAERAAAHEAAAKAALAAGCRPEAELAYRTAGLYLNLLQWIYPDADEDRRDRYGRSLERFGQADRLAPDAIQYCTVEVDGRTCYGRIRTPREAAGCIVIINPIDSSKEELFAYEADFARHGFITVSFDGPGQGETYTAGRLRATRERWRRFTARVIEETAVRFPDQPLYLFGTSSGASWAIHASAHPRVRRAVAVSPACGRKVTLPDYFVERMAYMTEPGAAELLPEPDGYERCSPVLLFHGQRDVMVRGEDIRALYRRLPAGRALVEFAEEGHCCNYKLDDIRRISANWLRGGSL